MKRRAALFACLLGGVAVLAWWGLRVRAPQAVVAVPCADIVAGCSVVDAGLQVAFDQRPQPLRPFLLSVRQPGARELHASFSMRGMEMGFNRYRLLPQAAGAWQAQVMLPACVQGRSDWELLLEIDGVRYALPFSAGERQP